MNDLPISFGRQRPKQQMASAYVSHWFSCSQKFDARTYSECIPTTDDDASGDSFGDLCNPELLAELYELKEQFNDIPPSQFKRSRSFTNPYETLGKGPFLNRSALKLVEVSTLVDLFETNKGNISDFTWVDVCGAPGGFSEYVARWHRSRGFACRGWGMTLRDPLCDWKLDIDKSTFTITYGEDDTGNCYHEKNLLQLQSLVSACSPQGVDMVLGDGGFTAARDIHDQELRMARLILCQMAAMALLLKSGGTWVCKVFSIHEPFTAALYGLAARVFHRICILKPLTSRPASAERYIVAEGFLRPIGLTEHLLAINRYFERGSACLPLPIPKSEFLADTALRVHLRAVNDDLLRREIAACNLILNHAIGKRVKVRQLSYEDRDSIAREWGIACDDDNNDDNDIVNESI